MTDKIIVSSFGYGHGAPPPAEHVFDVRAALHNPHHDPAMRTMTGLEPAVRHHVLSTPGAADIIDQMVRVITDDKSLTVAVGCVGGRHRSAALAQETADRLVAAGYDVQVAHRDVDKPLLPPPATRPNSGGEQP